MPEDQFNRNQKESYNMSEIAGRIMQGFQTGTITFWKDVNSEDEDQKYCCVDEVLQAIILFVLTEEQQNISILSITPIQNTTPQE